MTNKTIGFIGGGRITRILLAGWRKAGQFPAQVIVSDINTDVLHQLKDEFPVIRVAANDNQAAAAQDVVFLALHPPAVGSMLNEIKPCLQPNAVFISLAPKLTIQKLAEGLGGFSRIARVIPNAPSIIGQGYNPVAFSEGLNRSERELIASLFAPLGEFPVVNEGKLEAYAILTAMGPTYLWFQLNELHTISRSFGLSEADVQNGLLKMVTGAINTLYQADLSPEGVMDLVPVKPLSDEESRIKEIYHQKLEPLYAKLKS